MKNKMICFATLISNLIFTQNGVAAESLSTKVHNQYQSLRAMGMGNAFTTVADDYSAMMYNPATLAKKKHGEIQFTLAGAGPSAKTTLFLTEISDASKNGVDDDAKANAISTVLDQYYGKPLGGRAQALEIFWVRPNWGFAFLPLDLSLDLSANRQVGPAIDLNVKKDSTIAYGYGKNITENISAGILGKIIHRDSIEQSVAAAELVSDSNVLSSSRFKEGITADVEIGLIWNPEFSKKTVVMQKTVPVDEMKIETKPIEKIKTDADTAPAAETKTDETVRAPQSDETANPAAAKTESTDPTVAETKKPVDEVKKIEPETKIENKTETVNPLSISVVARNLISADFSKSAMVNKDATTAPSKIPRVIDIGVGYDLADWGDIKLRTTAEAKNILHPNASVRKSTHAGFEFDYSPGSWFQAQFRAGINQMYFTSGITLLLGVIEIDAVTYGEEVGTTSTNVENRVSAVKIGFNF